MKKFWKILIIVLLVLLVLAGGYVAYVFLDYHRIPDNQTLDVYEQEPQPIAQTGQDYRVLTWNIGFGAYEDDYGFFMDGGTESWAWSEDRLKANLAEISNVLLNEAADIYFLQEVDFDSTRTYHVDERPYLYQAQPDFCKLHAVNYDSPFLLYPLTQPHGASRSCLLTMAGLHVTSAVRRSLPVETGFTKLLDLDRCYSVARVPVENGHELCSTTCTSRPIPRTGRLPTSSSNCCWRTCRRNMRRATMSWAAAISTRICCRAGARNISA